MNSTYSRIAKTIKYTVDNFEQQPELKDLSQQVGLGAFYLQRTFKNMVGITPKQFLQYVTKEHLLSVLRESDSVMTATYESGLSSPSRAHDLLISTEGLTAGEFRKLGEGITIDYGVVDSPFGNIAAAWTGRGITALYFIDTEQDMQSFTQNLRRKWPAANLTENIPVIQNVIGNYLSATQNKNDARPALHINGRGFQIKVWEALLSIPESTLISYSKIAELLGIPKAARAVGNAVGANPVSLIIPCHRVIRETGVIGGYRWGIERKKAILGVEFSRAAV
jgi:AraC family transcriptional regulator of adaptative response/methylated-DNA-[protein]-cysteine methyltransferase